MPLHPARVWKMLIMQISELKINVKISATSHLNSVYCGGKKIGLGELETLCSVKLLK